MVRILFLCCCSLCSHENKESRLYYSTRTYEYRCGQEIMQSPGSCHAWSQWNGFTLHHSRDSTSYDVHSVAGGLLVGKQIISF